MDGMCVCIEVLPVTPKVIYISLSLSLSYFLSHRTKDAQVVAAVYENSDTWVETGSPGSAYGPVNVLYAL